jgi:hypothetical protein
MRTTATVLLCLPHVLNLKTLDKLPKFWYQASATLMRMTVGICNKEIVMKLLRESPAVLRMSSCTVKLDEEKSKHAS